MTTIVRSASHGPTRTRRYGLPNDVTPPSSPSLLLPANQLLFSAIRTTRPRWLGSSWEVRRATADAPNKTAARPRTSRGEEAQSTRKGRERDRQRRHRQRQAGPTDSSGAVAPSALINALASLVLSEPLSGRGLCDSAVEDSTKPVHYAYVGRERIPTRSAAPSLFADAPVEVTSRRHSTFRVLTL
jgi:hypothetical protein